MLSTKGGYAVTFLKTPNLVIDENTIASYCDYLTNEGCTIATIAQYQRILWKLYEFLPGNKLLDEDVVSQWVTQLTINGYSKSTISTSKSTVKGFLEYFTKSPQKDATPPPSPQTILTRDQYLRLLHRAKSEGRKRAYLLIKTIVNVGIHSRELEQLTVEALKEGGTWIQNKTVRRRASIPEPIRSELLDYAKEARISSGPIFITHGGTPLRHSAVWKEIKRVSQAEGVVEGAGNPRQLYLLHVATYKDIIKDKPFDDADVTYQQLLYEEEKLISWNM